MVSVSESLTKREKPLGGRCRHTRGASLVELLPGEPSLPRVSPAAVTLETVEVADEGRVALAAWSAVAHQRSVDEEIEPRPDHRPAVSCGGLWLASWWMARPGVGNGWPQIAQGVVVLMIVSLDVSRLGGLLHPGVSDKCPLRGSTRQPYIQDLFRLIISVSGFRREKRPVARHVSSANRSYSACRAKGICRAKFGTLTMGHIGFLLSTARSAPYIGGLY